MSYLETTAEFYAEAAKTPQVGLCCISTAPLQFPNLKIPQIIEQMNLDSVSFKVPIPSDGACVFAGKTAGYSGSEPSLDDLAGHVLQRGNPLSVCDKTATKPADKFPQDVMITDSTWHYNGGGCC